MPFTLATETVVFRDGSTLTGTEATWLEDARMLELEEVAKLANKPELEAAFGQPTASDEDEVSAFGKLTPEQRKIQYFRLNVYPKLAGCSTGDVPDMETAGKMPSSELNKWYRAAHRCNPDWFAMFDQPKNPTPAQVAEQEKKSETTQAQ